MHARSPFEGATSHLDCVLHLDYLPFVYATSTCNEGSVGGRGVRVENNISIQIHSRIRSQSVFKVQNPLHFVKFKFSTNPTQTRVALGSGPENLIRQLKQPQDVCKQQLQQQACKLKLFSMPLCPPRCRHIAQRPSSPWAQQLPRPDIVAPWHRGTVARVHTVRNQPNRQTGRRHTATPYFNYPFEQRSHYRNRILIARKLRPRAAVTRSSSKDFRSRERLWQLVGGWWIRNKVRKFYI